MKYVKIVCTLALGLSSSFCFAQEFALSAGLREASPALSTPTVKAPLFAPITDVAWQPKSVSWQPKFDRWLDLKEFDFALRYRGVDDSNGAHEFEQGQQRSIIDGKFKFDAKGRYGIVFHASSGRYFNWAYADFAGGGNEKALTRELQKASQEQAGHLGFFAQLFPQELIASEKSGGWSFYVRRLYLDVEPVKGIEAQYGSLDIDRGAATELTTYDNDGYIAGERLLIKRPKNIFFDEASVTYAYIGDLYTPNFFARGQRLAHSNYHQFLLRKKVGKRVDSSFDYTWQGGTNTLREAADFKIPESRILDSARFESYQRLNSRDFPGLPFPLLVAAGNGYAFTAAKKLGSRFSGEAGVADIDYGIGILTGDVYSYDLGLGLNGDSYGVGKRWFVRPTFKLTSYLSATGYYTDFIGPVNTSAQIIWNHQAFNGGLVLDLKKLLFKDSPTS